MFERILFALLILFSLMMQGKFNPINSLDIDRTEVGVASMLKNFVNSNLISTGTTIVGLCCRDGVILGADTRSTGGPIVMDKNKLKIHELSAKILCCAAGTSAYCDHLSRIVMNRLAIDNIGLFRAFSKENMDYNTVNVAAEYLCQMLEATQKKGEEDEEDKGPKAVFVVGGVDAEGPKLFQIDYEGFPCRIGYGSLGSGSIDALSILETELNQFTDRIDSDNPIINLSVEGGINIVRKAVKAGILNDLGSGSHIDLCVITNTETKRWRELSTESPSRQFPETQYPTTIEAQEVTSEDKPSNNEILGRLVWRPLSTRLIYKNRKLEETVLPEYDDHTPISIELLPDA